MHKISILSTSEQLSKYFSGRQERAFPSYKPKKGNGKIINDLEKNEILDKNLLRYMTIKVKKFDLETNYFSKSEDNEKKENDRKY